MYHEVLITVLPCSFSPAKTLTLSAFSLSVFKTGSSSSFVPQQSTKNSKQDTGLFEGLDSMCVKLTPLSYELKIYFIRFNMCTNFISLNNVYRYTEVINYGVMESIFSNTIKSLIKQSHYNCALVVP